MKCKYCIRWQECNPDLVDTIKISSTKYITERYCRVAGEKRQADDESCKDIKVAKYFYCNDLGDRPAVVVCLWRQGLLKRECPNPPSACNSCNQCVEVEELQRGRNLLIEHGYVKPKLPPIRKRNHENQSES